MFTAQQFVRIWVIVSVVFGVVGPGFASIQESSLNKERKGNTFYSAEFLKRDIEVVKKDIASAEAERPRDEAKLKAMRKTLAMLEHALRIAKRSSPAGTYISKRPDKPVATPQIILEPEDFAEELKQAEARLVKRINERFGCMTKVANERPMPCAVLPTSSFANLVGKKLSLHYTRQTSALFVVEALDGLSDAQIHQVIRAFMASDERYLGDFMLKEYKSAPAAKLLFDQYCRLDKDPKLPCQR